MAERPAPLDVLAETLDGGARGLGITDDTALLLAVSGGPDSMALLHGAARLVGSGARRWPLLVAHLDHGLREESGVDARFVAEAAASLGVPGEIRRVDVASLARADGIGLEEAGRRARYRFFEEVAPADGLIATAHTADDQAETLILRLVRGSGLRGLRGIPARRGRIVRPLLGERRSALRALLDAGGLAYRLDPTNLDPAAADRNRVRAELLPAMERLNPGVVAALGRYAELAAADDDLMEELAAAELVSRRADDGTLEWRRPPHRALGRRVLRRAIGEPAPDANRIDALLDAAEGERGGVIIELGGGRSAAVAQRRISLRHRS